MLHNRLEAERHDLDEQRIGVARRACENGVGKLLGSGQLRIENFVDDWIGDHLRPVAKETVFDKELRVQDVETIELGEEVGGRIGHRAERIVRMVLFPRAEGLVRLVEIEVVHLAVPRFDHRDGGHRTGHRRQRGREAR